MHWSPGQQEGRTSLPVLVGADPGSLQMSPEGSR